MPAIALTDHGAMFGALDFYQAARRHEIKPILGVEAYVAPRSRFDRTPGDDEEKYRHLTLLARNDQGYRNLLRLVTDAHLEGFYHRPRIDRSPPTTCTTRTRKTPVPTTSSCASSSRRSRPTTTG